MDLKELKAEIKYVKLYFSSVLARSISYVITTGNNTLYFTNVHPDEILINDINMTTTVSKVTYKNFDKLTKYLPILKIPNLCIHRDRISTIFNKSTEGAAVVVQKEEVPVCSEDERFKSGVEDTFLRYNIKQRGGIYYMEGVDKKGVQIQMKVDKDIRLTIPIATSVSVAMVRWFKEVCDVTVDKSDGAKITKPPKTNLWFVREWPGIAIPYVDGISGMNIGGCVSKHTKDPDEHFVMGYLQSVGSYVYLITQRELEEVSCTTIPKIFKMFPF